MTLHIDPSIFLEILKHGKDFIELSQAQLLSTDNSQHLSQNLETMEKGSLLWVGKELPPTAIENLAALGARFRKILEQVTGSEFELDHFQELPFSLVVDILDQAQLVDDEELRGLWASLLASNILDASEGGTESSRRAFASLLRDLSPLDAVNLRSIYSVDLAKIVAKNQKEDWEAGGTINERDTLFLDQTLAFAGISTSYLPDKSLQFDGGNADIHNKANEPLAERILVSLSNLARLNLVEPERMQDGGFNYKIVFLTPLGMAFAKVVFLEERQ